MRNIGEENWPERTRLIKSHGDDLSYIVTTDNLGSVKPGQAVDVTVQVTAPDNIKKYCSFFRLAFGEEENRFGQ